jgi:outer membrane biosynthesis protein TonB
MDTSTRDEYSYKSTADLSSLQSEVADPVEEGTIDFSFNSHGHKHTFQASTPAERDNWVAVLKTKIEAAKELATTVPETEGYKTALSELTKPTFVAPIAVPKKSVDKVEPKEDKKEEKKEEKAEAKVEKKEEKKEEKTARKSRSASRKRNSIFGTFSLGGKKEEKTEVAKEETPVAPAAEAPATEEAAAPAAEPVVAAEAPAAEAASPTEARPAAAKRNSIFESLKVCTNLLSILYTPRDFSSCRVHNTFSIK